MSHVSAVHRHPAYVATPAEAQAVPEGLTNERESKFARNVTVAVLVSAVLFLATISAWLWYGAHQFQNCL